MQVKNTFMAVILAAEMTSATVFGASVPGGLKSLPEDKVIDISETIFGPQKVEDPKSPNGKAAVYVPEKDAKGYDGIGMGVYIKSTKQNVGYAHPRPQNEGYNWYKIPRQNKDAEFPGGKNNSQVFLETWRIGAWVPENLKGKFDCWVLVKAQGPFYVPGSVNENKLFLASVLLVPAGFIGADLPDELKNFPAEKIIDISGLIYGPQKIAEHDSPAGSAALYEPALDAKNYGGIGMGVYTRSNKQSVGFARTKPKNEEYNWYKIPRKDNNAEFPGGKTNTQIYLENWRIGAFTPENLKGKFDCWISVKAQGPFYVPGSEKENKLFLDRVILVPLE